VKNFNLSKKISSNVALRQIVAVARQLLALAEDVPRVALFANAAAFVANFESAADWVAIRETFTFKFTIKTVI
jgi:hypothetical protein